MKSKSAGIIIIIGLSIFIFILLGSICNFQNSINNVLSLSFSKINTELEEICDEFHDSNDFFKTVENHREELYFPVKTIWSLKEEDYDITELKLYLDTINNRTRTKDLSKKEQENIKKSFTLLKNEFIDTNWSESPGLGTSGYYNFAFDPKKISSMAHRINDISKNYHYKLLQFE